jgi:hypothetical protein
MGKIVASAWFQVAVVPLMLMMVGVFAKRLGRRDGDNSPRSNDWAVGTTILLMLLGTVLGDLRTAQGRTSELLAWLIGVLFTAFLSLDHDRFRSWKRNDKGLPQKENACLWASFCLICCAWGSFAFIRHGRLI